MTDTTPPPQQPAPDTGFEPGRLRTIADMRRSSDDRMVAGACAGVARHLGIDPVVVRVAVAVLTIVGGAGLILYVAAWIFVPSDDAERSVAADWFNLGRNELQVRTIALTVAAVVAALSALGDAAWDGWGNNGGWPVLPVLVVVLVILAVRSRRQDRRTAAGWAPPPGTPGAGPVPPGTPGTAYGPAAAPFATTTYGPQPGAPAGHVPPTPGAPTAVQPPVPPRPPLPPRERRSKALPVLTLSIGAIALAVAYLAGADAWTTYVAVALGVVTVALLVGTVAGHAGLLVPLGLVLGLVLIAGTVAPDARWGAQELRPVLASGVDAEYEHGMGAFELDLTQVRDPQALLGRTVSIDTGFGETRVVVPAGLPVRVESSVQAGQLDVLQRSADGTEVDLVVDTRERAVAPVGTPGGPVLTLDVEHDLGRILVETR
ncbi:PspC domain-containing protein [Aeromicrobium massiliense]|uniref:PspC domain-containing protein n=1 Tax=Aeromicrobium massiliense TaxID=1464554 RepID=UPI000578A963|nr:PspC domain-containing protein [Aeromicrobium massiliense]